MTATITHTGTVDPARLSRWMAEDPTVRLIDVRTGGEFETVHIPGAYNVPLDTVSEHATELATVDQPVVLICRSGGRASTAQDALSAAGKQGLHVLEGGMLAWEADDREVVRGTTERWAMDRQVRLAAGSLVVAGILASTVVPKAKWLAGAVGGGLVFSAVTDTCGMAMALAKLPYNQTDACDINQVLADLTEKGTHR